MSFLISPTQSVCSLTAGALASCFHLFRDNLPNSSLILKNLGKKSDGLSLDSWSSKLDEGRKNVP